MMLTRLDPGAARRRIGSVSVLLGRSPAAAAMPTLSHDSIHGDNELLELFFSQSLTGAFFMMLDEPIAWHAPNANREALLDLVFATQRVTRINDAMLAQYGATREQFIGWTPADFHAHNIEEGRAAWADFFDRGQSSYETDERRLDGTPIRIEGEYIVLRTADGRIAGHFGVQRDVTERHAAELARRASEARYEAAFRLSPFRLTINRLDDGRFLEVNDAFLRDLRRTRDEVLGKTSVELGLWADPSMRERYIERLRREGTITDLEFAGYERDGRREVTQLSSTLIELHGVACVLTIAHDVTDRRIAEAELETSQKQLRALASRQQHTREEERRAMAREVHDELGQLLTGVKLDLARAHAHLVHAPDGVRERLASALERTAEAMNVVRRIATELRPAVLDDLGLVAALEWQVEQFAALTGVRVTTTLPASDPPFDSDTRTAVFRIAQEALTNVARHAQASSVHVSLKVNAARVQLIVRDDGRGITLAEQHASHALGLLGLRERALAVGGTVRIDGRPGHGTEVALTLPRSSDAT
jgi:PAS domain S-box-containing protein